MKLWNKATMGIMATAGALALTLSGCNDAAQSADNGVQIVSVPQVTQLLKTVEAPPPVPVGPAPSGTYDIFKGPNYTDRVVLTFDDCPKSVEQLRQVSEAAKARNVGLVLAPIGQCIEELGQGVVDIARANGQYVINHSVSHKALSKLSVDGVIRELSAPGVVTNFGRPPYGDGFFTTPYSANVVAGYEAVNMKPWLWTVDTNDWKGKSADSIVSYVLASSGPGDTVLMHMNHNGFNVESVVAMIDGLRARGLEVCQAYPGGETPVTLPESLPC